MIPFVLFCSFIFPALLIPIVFRYQVFRKGFRRFFSKNAKADQSVLENTQSESKNKPETKVDEETELSKTKEEPCTAATKTIHLKKAEDQEQSSSENTQPKPEIQSEQGVTETTKKSKTLMTEEPYAAAINTKYLPFTCSKCFKWNTPDEIRFPLSCCDGCKAIFYCSEKCQMADWDDHKAECAFFCSTSFFPSGNVRLVARMLRKRKSEPDWKAFNGRTYDSLMDHCEHHRKDENFMATVNSDFIEFQMLMGSDAPDFETFFFAKSKLDINAFGMVIRTPKNEFRGECLYIGLSVHNHSCRPDAFVIQQGSTLLLRTTNIDCVYSDKVTISYRRTEYIERDLRQSYLWNQYFFVCKCEECEDAESVIAANKAVKDGILNESYFSQTEDPVSIMIEEFFIYQSILSVENVYLRLLADNIRKFSRNFDVKLKYFQITYFLMKKTPYSFDLLSMILEMCKIFEQFEMYEEADEVNDLAIEKTAVLYGEDHYLTEKLKAKKEKYNALMLTISE